ncbi:TPA: hypothetical protein ACIPUI_000242 [Citrobacter freundii]
MGNLFILNASDSEIFISLNDGDYLNVPAANTGTWTPSRPDDVVEFINKISAAQGQLGLGENEISVYPGTSGPASAATFILNVPTDVRVSSIELYLFWKSATSVAWVALNSGQPFQVSFTTEYTHSIKKEATSDKSVTQNNRNTNILPSCTITARL